MSSMSSMSSFKYDIKNANKAMVNQIIPYLKTLPEYQDAEFVCCEQPYKDKDKDPLYSMIDFYCGIDWFVKKGDMVYSLAVRCQINNNDKGYESFTIRAHRDTGTATELSKRREAIQKDATYPNLTIQAYLNEGWDSDFHSVAIVSTRELYKIIDNPNINLRTRTSDNSMFYIVPWQILKCSNSGIKVYNNNNNKG